MNDDELKLAYSTVFDTPQGRAVLRDLRRVASLTRINSDEPNTNAALYMVAQLALLRRIESQSNVRAEY